MKKEILITGIICLFVGVGIQPAFANENISINRPSENIEDCNCQVADNYNLVRLERLFNRIESLLDRVEILTKLIPILSKGNHEVLEDCEELSDKIIPVKEMNEEYNSYPSFEDYPLICAILESILLLTYSTIEIVWDLINMSKDTNPMFANFIWLFMLVPLAFLYVFVSDMGYDLDCNWYP